MFALRAELRANKEYRIWNQKRIQQNKNLRPQQNKRK